MTRSRELWVVLLTSGAALLPCVGCRREPPPAPAPPPVTVVRPVAQEVTEWADYTGTTQALETADVRARVQGWLQSMHYRPDSYVQKDALLFVIDPGQYQAVFDAAKAALAERQAAEEFARFEQQRIGKLVQQGAAAEYERNQSIANLDQARAAVQAAQASLEQAQLNLDYTQVTSPISGRVGRNLVDVGNLVGAASQPTLLATVVNDRSVYVYFTVSEAEHLRYVRTHASSKAGGPSTRPAKDRIAYLGLSDEKDYPHEGYLDYVDVRIDPATGTLLVRAIFADPTGILIPGLFARIRVPLRTYRALVVPDVAVGSDPAGEFVLLVNSQDVVERRAVRAGDVTGTMRVIEEGLTPADRVVVAGLQRARPGASVRVQESPASPSQPAQSQPAASEPSPAAGP